ncbi:LPS assembly lipoprotein LptE [Pseudidiomarina woesei]|uniref:LPS-assembly lipoprotein LptE n=1 Tax=Pseudidiomarina woesei TaxID=1381080 RepID=A0A0K6GXE4_9GAMM|nr:LPS assembly lipoprotein LptE [Pseudidiomarina woesei]CUA83406.1 Outer membrane lipoprotein LptE/RlpB (LPS assembly) [Pseudidiomarina woesei]
MMRQLLQYLVILLVTLTLVGCGFHLRDSYQLPPNMHNVAIEASAFSEFRSVLKQRFELAGAEIVAAEQAGLVVMVINDQLNRRTLSLSQSGQVAEYELIYTVNYQLLLPDKAPRELQVEVYRDYQDDPNFALAKTREREVLVREMRDEAARQLLRQTIAQLIE